MPEPAGHAPVAGIVLAAGHSSRMGHNKLLLEVAGEPLVRRTARRAVEAGLSPVLVVLGFEAERVRQALAGLPVTEVLNPDYERGINGSVSRGIAAVPAGCSAAIVILGDMPLVTAPMLEALVTRHRETGASLVLSMYGDVQAPPTLYGRELFAEFHTRSGEGCGKKVVREHGERAERVTWPAELLADIDEAPDYASVTDRLAAARTAGEGD